MSCNVFVQQFHAPHVRYSAVVSEHGLQLQVEALYGGIGVRDTKLRVMTACPQIWHIELDWAVCRPGTWVSEMCSAVSAQTFLGQECMPFQVPFRQGSAELLLRDATQWHRNMQQLVRRFKVGSWCQVPAHNLNHVVMAHLNTVNPQCREQSAHAVAHNAVYTEAVVVQPAYALKVVRHTFAAHVLVPQHLVPEGVFYYHKAEVPPPICRVRVDDDIFVPGYDMYVSHAVKPASYGAHTQSVFVRQLPQCHIFVYIIRYYQLAAWPFATYKLTAAIQTFIQLAVLAPTVLFYVRWLAPFTLFLFIKSRFSPLQIYWHSSHNNVFSLLFYN